MKQIGLSFFLVNFLFCSCQKNQDSKRYEKIADDFVQKCIIKDSIGLSNIINTKFYYEDVKGYKRILDLSNTIGELLAENKQDGGLVYEIIYHPKESYKLLDITFSINVSKDCKHIVTLTFLKLYDKNKIGELDLESCRSKGVVLPIPAVRSVQPKK